VVSIKNGNGKLQAGPKLTVTEWVSDDFGNLKRIVIQFSMGTMNSLDPAFLEP
jgi:hypothetical protein